MRPLPTDLPRYKPKPPFGLKVLAVWQHPSQSSRYVVQVRHLFGWPRRVFYETNGRTLWMRITPAGAESKFNPYRTGEGERRCADLSAALDRYLEQHPPRALGS